jgi:8-oxo-dGTP diphosphatase
MLALRNRRREEGAVSGSPTGNVIGARQVFDHDPAAPLATVVVPSVFVAARGPDRTLLLVRRCDSGGWELPGGRVDVGECAVAAAVRETAEESGVLVAITGIVGVYTDPGLVVRAVDGEVRQPFSLVLRAVPVGGTLCADRHETSLAAWLTPSEIDRLPLEPGARDRIDHALADGPVPHLH